MSDDAARGCVPPTGAALERGDWEPQVPSGTTKRNAPTVRDGVTMRYAPFASGPSGFTRWPVTYDFSSAFPQLHVEDTQRR